MVIHGLGSALDGMRAARTRLDGAAHNIANLITPGARRQVTDLSATADGGVRAARRTTDGPIDLATEAIEVNAAAVQYTASAHVARVMAEVERSTVDLLA